MSTHISGPVEAIKKLLAQGDRFVWREGDVLIRDEATANLIRASKRLAEQAEMTREILQDRFRNDHPGCDDAFVAQWCNWGALDTTDVREAIEKMEEKSDA